MAETIDPETGEIVEDGGESAMVIHAADGGLVKKRSGYVNDVIGMLEDGQFNADLSEKMRELVKLMEAHAHNNKGAAKGKINITLDVVMANGAICLTGDYKVTPPKEKRLGTMLFAGETGSLGRNPVGQRQMFGDRPPRDGYAGEDRPVRDV